MRAPLSIGPLSSSDLFGRQDFLVVLAEPPSCEHGRRSRTCQNCDLSFAGAGAEGGHGEECLFGPA